jgi:hypothetical protein
MGLLPALVCEKPMRSFISTLMVASGSIGIPKDPRSLSIRSFEESIRQIERSALPNRIETRVGVGHNHKSTHWVPNSTLLGLLRWRDLESGQDGEALGHRRGDARPRRYVAQGKLAVTFPRGEASGPRRAAVLAGGVVGQAGMRP